jgi:DNA ligase (NAD+)
MSNVQNKDSMLALISKIIDADKDYYLTGDSKHTDRQYGILKDDLRRMVVEFPEIAAELRAQDILDKVGQLPMQNLEASVTHRFRMYSLDNSYNREDYIKWYQGILKLAKMINTAFVYTIIISFKMDGSAVKLTYNKGALVKAATRGNGEVGEEITASVAVIPNVPKKVKRTDYFEVSGEVVLPWLEFEMAKEIDNYPYKNPRNAANGIVGRKNPGEATKLLKFFAYGFDSDKRNELFEQDLEELEAMGFETVAYAVCETVEEAMETVEEFEASRSDQECMIDGAVSRFNQHKLYRAAGFTSHHPLAAIASKFESIKAEVILRDVIWTKGLKGKLSPNAIYDPTDLGGITNDRCLTHTKRLMDELGMKIGAVTIIEKCGDIIPQVAGIRQDLLTGNETDIIAPSECPICQGQTSYRGDYLYCFNEDCGNNGMSRLLTWVNAIDFKGIGDKAAERLANNGSFKYAPDFFKLTERDLIDAEVAPKNATKLVTAIANAISAIQPQQVVHGLSIDYCGRGTSEDLIVEAGLKIRDMVRKSQDWFEQVPNIGPVTAESLSNWFNKPVNIAIIEELYNMGVIRDEVEKVAVNTAGSLFKELICITGTLSEDKKFFYPLIEQAGGQFTEDFKKTITKMVVGEKAGSKETKAKDAGITIWSEQDLRDALGI